MERGFSRDRPPGATRLPGAAFRRDRRLAENQNGKRKVAVVAREKGGRTVTKVFNSEAAGVAEIASVVDLGSTVHADEAPHWDALHDRFLTKRINHEWAYSDEGACTNDAESFFSRVSRATASAALKHPVSRQWKGYWQRGAEG